MHLYPTIKKRNKLILHIYFLIFQWKEINSIAILHIEELLRVNIFHFLFRSLEYILLMKEQISWVSRWCMMKNYFVSK